LIIAAAFIHATWNFLAKRASGHATFTWLFAGSALHAARRGAHFFSQTRISLVQVGFMAGSAALHTAYFLLLNQGYRVGDLSLVYPLARGTGPLLSTMAAIFFFGERPSTLALTGGLLVVGGVIVLTTRPSIPSQGTTHRAVGYAFLTGTFIAGYTLWDKQAVSAFLIPPLVLDWGANLGRALLLTPLALRQWGTVIIEWKTHRFEAFGVALLAPLSYIFVLMALQFTPVSYVAPAREISILIGAAMGARFLGEGDVRRRLTGAGAMMLGVVALALG
jgi:uncharacterized membrane protein